MSADAHLGPLTENPYDLTCSYAGLDGNGPLCGLPATVHLMFQRSDGYQGGATACGPHADWALRGGWGVVDHHPTTDSACCMPTAMWIAGPPSRCEIDASGVEPVLAAGRELVHARTAPPLSVTEPTGDHDDH